MAWRRGGVGVAHRAGRSSRVMGVDAMNTSACSSALVKNHRDPMQSLWQTLPIVTLSWWETLARVAT